MAVSLLGLSFRIHTHLNKHIFDRETAVPLLAEISCLDLNKSKAINDSHSHFFFFPCCIAGLTLERKPWPLANRR